MFLTKWSPRNSCNTIWDVFEKDFFPTRRVAGSDEESFRSPLTNINETETDYVVTLEMPGVAKNQVEVTLEGDTLTVTGERVEKLEEKGLLRREIREEKFSRSFRLGDSVDRDKVKARMDNGILTVTLPKVEKEVGRKVDID